MERRLATAMLSLLLLACASAQAAGWVAFIAPDIPQGRLLFGEFRKLVAEDLASNQLELRFVAVENVPDGPGVEEPIARAVAQRPRVILAAAERIAVYAKAHTSTIPVIFGSSSNPIRGGLVDSLARPGGNLTGFTSDIEIERKQLELLKEAFPKVRRVGVLNDGTWFPNRVTSDQLAACERAFGITIRIFTGSAPGDMADIVRSAEGRRVDAWLVPVHNLTGMARDDVIKAINAAGKPAVYGRTFFVDAGGLMSYQETIVQPMAIWAEMFRMILKGVPPGAIPIRLPRDFVMALNIDQARRSGVSFTPSLLRRADKVVGAPSPKP